MDKAIDTTAKALASLSHHVGSNKDQGPSKGFQTLIRMIGEAKTKHEEDRIIRKESIFLKEKIGAADVSPRQMRELLIRLIYCEMLGVECSWGYIHAIKMTQSGNIMDKRTGYLATSLFLHENHELNMLLVNTLQRDLKSSNMLLVSMALIIICKLIGSEMIPPLLPLIQEKLHHPKELVRKKAVMVMHHFYSLSPSTVSHLEDDFRRVISDKDPGVMEAALILFHDMITDNPSQFKNLVPSFTNILSQVIARKLPSDFDYHSVPAPWIQIRLLRILALLGADDLKSSEQLYPVVEKCIASAECNSNIGQAISYECIRTIASIYPNSSLIEKAAKTIGRFVTASNNNWKYLGINSLASLVQINPKYAADHQVVVIDCLDDPDDTLKRKTLDLLYKMTNPSNVAVITDRLVSYLHGTRDEYIKSDLVSRITQLAERFAPDNLWFIQTMNAVFELGGTLVRKEVAHNLMRLIAEGTEDEETDMELRLDAVSSYLGLLDKPHLPDILVKIICWVVGEYAYLVEDIDIESILDKMTVLLGSRFTEADTAGWVVTAITKLVSQLGRLPESVQSHLAVYLTSTATDIQQRCSELVELSQDISVMQEVMPLDSSCEDLEVDSSLSFLDGFVSEALAKGSSSYKPPHLRVASPLPKAPSVPSSIKYEPYALPQANKTYYPQSKVDSPTSQRARKDSNHTHSQPQALNDANRKATTNYTYTAKDDGLAVKERKWGKTGYNKSPTPVLRETTLPEILKDNLDSEQQKGGASDSIIGEEEVDGKDQPSAEVNPIQASVLPVSKEELKRKKLANQLFGGLSGPSRAPKVKQQRKGSTEGGAKFGTTSSPSRGGMARNKPDATGDMKRHRQQQEPQVDLLLDLQEIDFSSPGVPPSGGPDPPLPLPAALSNPPSSTLPVTSTGLLSNMEIHDSFQPAPTAILPVTIPPATIPPATIPPAAVPPAAVSPATIPPTQNDLLDLLDGPVSALIDNTSSLTSDPTPLNSQGTLALTLFETPVSSIRVPQEYTQFPISPDCENKDICQDTNLRVSLTKVFKPAELVLVFFLTNQKQEKLSEAKMVIDPPTTMKASKGEESLSFTVDLSGFASATHVIVLTPSSPAINMSIHGQISYKDHMSTTRRLFFDVSIYISDVIRPLKIVTQEFGKTWGTFTYEKKLKLPSPSSVKSPAQFMEVMKTKFNFHPVEIIGMEGISAGRFLPSTVCLVHGKVQKSHLDFWVRTPSNLLTESIAKLAQTLFK